MMGFMACRTRGPRFPWPGTALMVTLLFPAGTARAEAPERALRETLQDPALVFCHDAAYPLSDREALWCGLVASGDDAACPALGKSCAQGARAEHIERLDLPAFELPELPELARSFLWALVGAAGLALLFAILRASLAQRSSGGLAAAPAAARATQAHPLQEAAADSDVARLRALAQAAATAGRFDEAVTLLHAATLRHLEGQALIVVHRSLTNGDYVRKLRRPAPDIATRLGKIVSDVERVQFGGEPASPGLYHRVLVAVDGLLASPAARALLLPLLATLSLTLGACQTPREDWDHSPSGHQGVIDFLNRAGLPTRERLSSLDRLDESTAQLVLLANAEVDEAQWASIASWLELGGRLILAPGPRVLPDWLPFTIERLRPADAHPTPLLAGKGFHDRVGALVPTVPIMGRIVSREASLREPLLHAAGVPYALSLETKLSAEVLVFADGALFQNASLAVPNNALFLHRLLADDDYSGTIDLVGDLAGLVAANPASSIARGRLAPFMVQLFLFVAIFFAAKGVMFARPRDPAPATRRRFVEHIEALGLQYRRARAFDHVLSAHGTLVVERLARRQGVMRSGFSALAESLSRRFGRPLGETARLIMEAREPVAPAHGRAGAREAGLALTAKSRALFVLSGYLRTKSAARAPAPRRRES